MATIIAGMFDTIDKAAGAIDDLLGGEFNDKDVFSFANNPPGQHAVFPIGGDENKDPGASHAESDAGKGAALGIGTGAAIGAVAAGPPGGRGGAGARALLGPPAGALHRAGGGRPPQQAPRGPPPALALV